MPSTLLFDLLEIEAIKLTPARRGELDGFLRQLQRTPVSGQRLAGSLPPGEARRLG